MVGIGRWSHDSIIVSSTAFGAGAVDRVPIYSRYSLRRT
jgi:hypothetical protein